MHTFRNRICAAFAGLLVLGLTVGLLSPRAKSSGGPVPVQVANSSTGPAQVQDVDGPTRQPFTQGAFCSIQGGSGTATISVPAGKRLTITYVSVFAAVLPGESVIMDVDGFFNGNIFSLELPVAYAGKDVGNAAVYQGSDPVCVTVDPGSTIYLNVTDSNHSSNFGSADVTIGGYLTDAS